jgi:hypothetical protein
VAAGEFEAVVGWRLAVDEDRIAVDGQVEHAIRYTLGEQSSVQL